MTTTLTQSGIKFSDSTVQSSAAIPTHEVIKTTMFGPTGSFTQTFNRFFMIRYNEHRNCSNVNQWYYSNNNSGWIYNAGTGNAVNIGYGYSCWISCWDPIEMNLGSFSNSLMQNLAYSNLNFRVVARFGQNTDDGCMIRVSNTWGGADVEASFGGWSNDPWCGGGSTNPNAYTDRTIDTNVSLPKATLLSGTAFKLKFAARIPGGSGQYEGVCLKDVTVSFVSWS